MKKGCHYNLKFNGLKPDYVVWCWPFWKHILNPLTYWRWVSRFCQRGFYGYADNDCWEARSYLECIIIGIIKDLKENTHGFPTILSDYPDGTWEENDPPDTGPEKWKSILNEIIEGLEASRELELEETVPKGIYSEGPFHFEDLGNGLSRFVDESNHKFDMKAYEAWRKPLLDKRKRAALLIIKYWDSFWD